MYRSLQRIEEREVLETDQNDHSGFPQEEKHDSTRSQKHVGLDCGVEKERQRFLYNYQAPRWNLPREGVLLRE